MLGPPAASPGRQPSDVGGSTELALARAAAPARRSAMRRRSPACLASLRARSVTPRPSPARTSTPWWCAAAGSPLRTHTSANPLRRPLSRRARLTSSTRTTPAARDLRAELERRRAMGGGLQRRRRDSARKRPGRVQDVPDRAATPAPRRHPHAGVPVTRRDRAVRPCARASPRIQLAAARRPLSADAREQVQEPNGALTVAQAEEALGRLFGGHRPRIVQLVAESLSAAWAEVQGIADALGQPDRGRDLVGALERRVQAVAVAVRALLRSALPSGQRPRLECRPHPRCRRCAGGRGRACCACSGTTRCTPRGAGCRS